MIQGRYEVLSEQERQKPGDAMIDGIRKRYPTEPEIDRVLSTKMLRRQRGLTYEGASLEQLVDGASRLIAERTGHAAKISNPYWLSGGASKLQIMFDAEWREPAAGRTCSESLVLRMEPAASITESSRSREYEVIKAIEGIIPAPKAYWVDPDGSFLPYPAMIYSFVTGTAKPSYDAGKVTGLGQNYGPELRARLAPHFVGLLAKLHTVPIANIDGMDHFARPEIGSNASIIRQVNAIRRVWEEDRVEEEPTMEIVYRWLIKHAPELDHVSVVHGDYRGGNFLFDEEAGEITAVLDWEGATLGDRHQDLTYATLPAFSHMAEDGKTQLGSGMMSVPETFEAYEKASGLPVIEDRLTYFRIFNHYLLVMLTLAASARASRSRGTHQDVLVNYLVGVGYPVLDELRGYYRRATS